MSKFKMLLQRFVQEYLYNTSTMWIYVCVDIYIYHCCCLLLLILIIFRLTPSYTGWIQGINTSCIDPLWIFHIYKSLSFTLALRYLIKTEETKIEGSIKRVSYCSYFLFCRWVSIQQSNHFPSSTSIMSPTTTIIISDSS